MAAREPVLPPQVPRAPRIGVTWSADIAADGKPYDEPGPYAAALERHGAHPVLLDCGGDPEVALRELDGVLLSGGQDVAPERYGGRRLAGVQPANLRRDAFEAALALMARDGGIPLLGICRGMQIANVALGGTLIEDIPSEVSGALTHGVADSSGEERTGILTEHIVRLESDSSLRAVFGMSELVTNSIHHQAVHLVAPQLRISGRTPDHIIEAVEARFAHPFYVAVQWHPELLIPRDGPSRGLFAAFVAAAATYASDGRFSASA